MSDIKLNVLKNLTLLLVEDDDDLIQQFESILRLFFGKIFIAKNGTEALKIYTQNKIDMIITDYVMPSMDGYEFSKAIRLSNQHIPIVMMSSYSDKEKLLNAITLGLVDYLIKPFDYNTLIRVLNAMVLKMEKECLPNFTLSDSLIYSSLKKELLDITTGSTIKLSKSEIELIDLFVHHQGQVITYDILENTLWLNDPKGNDAIKNIIYRLRKKLGQNFILNIQDMGYMFKPLTK